MAKLTQEEIELCSQAFEKFDKDGSGSIDVWELKNTLQAMGQNPTEDELFNMMSEVDDDGSGEIEFAEFIKLLEKRKELMSVDDTDADFVDAFVAMGGAADKTGQVNTDNLRKTIKVFGLTIDIDALIAEYDTNRDGYIDFNKFKQMLSECGSSSVGEEANGVASHMMHA